MIWVYRGVILYPWQRDLLVCLHCGTPTVPTAICENCGSYAKRLVKVDDLKREEQEREKTRRA